MAQKMLILINDAANCAIANQNTPSGYYNIERMLKATIAKGAANGFFGENDSQSVLKKNSDDT